MLEGDDDLLVRDLQNTFRANGTHVFKVRDIGTLVLTTIGHLS